MNEQENKIVTESQESESYKEAFKIESATEIKYLEAQLGLGILALTVLLKILTHYLK